MMFRMVRARQRKKSRWEFKASINRFRQISDQTGRSLKEKVATGNVNYLIPPSWH